MIEPNAKQVGKRIKEIREDIFGLSMSKFGAKIDEKTKSGTVANWETGKNLPNIKRLNRIAELGNTTVQKLLYGEPIQFIWENYVLLDEDKKEESIFRDCEFVTNYKHVTSDTMRKMADFLEENDISYDKAEDYGNVFDDIAREQFERDLNRLQNDLKFIERNYEKANIVYNEYFYNTFKKFDREIKVPDNLESFLKLAYDIEDLYMLEEEITVLAQQTNEYLGNLEDFITTHEKVANVIFIDEFIKNKIEYYYYHNIKIPKNAKNELYFPMRISPIFPIEHDDYIALIGWNKEIYIFPYIENKLYKIKESLDYLIIYNDKPYISKFKDNKAIIDGEMIPLDSLFFYAPLIAWLQ